MIIYCAKERYPTLLSCSYKCTYDACYLHVSSCAALSIHFTIQVLRNHAGTTIHLC